MGNPNQWIDPLGLVEWKGTEKITTIGAISKGNYHLVSQCIDKYQAELEIDTVAAGVGTGISFIGISRGSVNFYDNNPTIYINNFKGASGGGAIGGAVAGKGLYYGGTAIGNLSTNIETYRNQSTLNTSAGSFLGSVVNIKEKWKYCGISEKPICGPGGCRDGRRSKVDPSSHFNPYPISRPVVKNIAPSPLPQTAPTRSDQIKFNSIF